MTRIIWQWIKDKLIFPFLDIELDYYDLGMEHRDATDDKVTTDARPRRSNAMASASSARPLRLLDEARVKEFGLKQMWKSPNGTIRNILGGGRLPRADHLQERAACLVPGWTQPIIIGRHAYGDQYHRATDFKVPGPGKLTVTWKGDNGDTIEREVFNYPGSGVALTMYNLDDSIRRLRASPRSAMLLARKVSPLPFRPRTPSSRPMTDGSKTSSKRFMTQLTVDRFKAAGLTYEHRLIDDMVAAALKWSGSYCLGMQELRRRRAVRHRRAGIWIPGPG